MGGAGGGFSASSTHKICFEKGKTLMSEKEHDCENFRKLQESKDALIQQKLETMQQWVKADIREHHNTLYGNGKDGLCERVTRIEENRKATHKIYAAIATGLGIAIGWLGLGK
jgi:hypothetical protein